MAAAHFANALRDSVTRFELLQAMRRSPYTGHRILLRDLLAGSAGMRVLSRFIDGDTPTSEAARRAIDQLGNLEVYMPGRTDRRTWKGEPSLYVAARVKADGQFARRAFHTSGAILNLGDLPTARATHPAGPVIMIRPAGVLSVRYMPQSPGSGEVIQDAGDGEIGGYTLKRLANGDSVVTQLADYWRARGIVFNERPASPGFSTVTSNVTGSGATLNITPGTDTTWLGSLYLIDAYDHGYDPFLELRFYSKYFVFGGGTATQMDYQEAGIDAWSHFAARIDLPLIARKFGRNSWVQTDVAENDGTTFHGDTWGTLTLNNSDYNAQNYISQPFWGTSLTDLFNGDRCGTLDVNGYWTCPYPTHWNIWYWSGVNLNAWWRPAPGGDGSFNVIDDRTATIHGPTAILPAASCYWNVSHNVSTGSVNYEWRANGDVVGTDQELWYSASSDFTLTVSVWDDTHGASATSAVSVSSSNSICYVE